MLVLALAACGARDTRPRELTRRIRIVQHVGMCTSCENVVELFATGELAVERSDGPDVHVEERWIARTQAEDLFHRLDLAGFYAVVPPREGCAYASDDGSVVLTVVDGANSRTLSLSSNRWACPELDRLSGILEAIQELARDTGSARRSSRRRTAGVAVPVRRGRSR